MAPGWCWNGRTTALADRLLAKLSIKSRFQHRSQILASLLLEQPSLTHPLLVHPTMKRMRIRPQQHRVW